MEYPFNVGDLLCCIQCACGYLENNVKVPMKPCHQHRIPSHINLHTQHSHVCRFQVPWEDMRYLFGEIIYGGHIVEDWDRRLAAAYLAKFLNESLMDDVSLFSGFDMPRVAASYKQVRHMEPLCEKGPSSSPSNLHCARASYHNVRIVTTTMQHAAVLVPK